jgi:biotin carboxyl carrier protein
MQHVVQSPIPGVFYRRPDPGSPTYAEEGDQVSADQTIGLVEIMKQFVEIKAGVDGVLEAFTAEENAALGPGDTIAILQVS